jgi:ADP-heptose:LPS heptosyltransferase
MHKLENIKSVIIIRSGALGDTVYATAVLDALKRQFGEETIIDWVGTPACLSLFKYDERVHQVFVLKHRKLPAIINLEKRRIISYSKKHAYDLLINLEQGTHFHDLAKKIKATVKIGNPFTKPEPTSAKMHMVEFLRSFYMSVIDQQICTTSYPKLFGAPFALVQKNYSLPDEYIILNPSNSHTKRDKINYRAWPVEKWKELIDKLSEKQNIVLIGNSGEESYFKHLQPYPKTLIDLSGRTGLAELIAVIENAKYMVTTDTGPAHIASATSTPVYCLIGPTNPDLTGPYKTPKNEVYIISKDLECSPCYYLPHRQTCKDNVCMKEICVADVAEAISKHS